MIIVEFLFSRICHFVSELQPFFFLFLCLGGYSSQDWKALLKIPPSDTRYRTEVKFGLCYVTVIKMDLVRLLTYFLQLSEKSFFVGFPSTLFCAIMFGHSCLICLPILSVVCNFLSLSDVFNSTMLDSHCANEFRYIVCLNVSLITEIKKKKGGLV